MKSRPGGEVEESRRLAVLIDADNAQPMVIESLLAEVARYGVASVKRIYGDFTSNQQTQWKKVLLKHSIQPMQQFAYTSGKNATDSSLIIDAMDLLYTGRFQGFCLVSSDSDFTRLAQRLRESGMTVYGFGERKTPDPFVQACDKFLYTEVLRPENGAEAAVPVPAHKLEPGPGPEPGSATAAVAFTPPAAVKPQTPSKPPFDVIRQAIEDASDDEGWAHLGAVGAYINKIRSDFDPRLYGKKKLSDLLRQYPKRYELQDRGTAGHAKVLYVRALD